MQSRLTTETIAQVQIDLWNLDVDLADLILNMTYNAGAWNIEYVASPAAHDVSFCLDPERPAHKLLLLDLEQLLNQEEKT